MRVDPHLVQVGLQVIDHVGILRFLNLGACVIHGEGVEDRLRIVDEVHDEGRVLAGRGAVESGERLDNLHRVGDLLVQVHCAQLGLVEAGLELVGHDHDPELRTIEHLAQVGTVLTRVHGAFGKLLIVLRRERVVLQLLVGGVHDLIARE